MTNIPALKDYLLSRRSVTMPFLQAPGPEGTELDELLTIATRVPDHGKLTPWRLVVYRGDARITIGEKLSELFAKRYPDASSEMVAEEKKCFLPAPLTIGVLASPKEHPKVPEMEQVLSAGCVAFNLVHGANALGYGAHWVTRWFAFDPDASAFLGANEGEKFVAFVHIGTPETKLEDRDRPTLDDVVTVWGD